MEMYKLETSLWLLLPVIFFSFDFRFVVVPSQRLLLGVVGGVVYLMSSGRPTDIGL